MTQMPQIIFRPPTQGGATKNLALIGLAVLEENIFENVNGRTDYGRTPDHGHTISLQIDLKSRFSPEAT